MVRVRPIVLAADPDFLRTTRAYSRVQPAFRIPPPLPPSTLSAFDLPFRSLRVPSFHKSRSFSSPSLATNVILLLRTCVNYLKLYTFFEMIIFLSMKSDKFFIEYGFQKKGKNPNTPYVTTRKRRHCPS